MHLIAKNVATRLSAFCDLAWPIVAVALSALFMALAAFFAASQWLALDANLMTPNQIILGADFISFWSAGHLAVSNHAVEAYNLEAIQAAHALASPKAALTPYHYPPIFTLLLAPLGLLDYKAAYIVFSGATAGLFLLICWKLRPHWTTLLFTLGFSGFWINLLDGQNGFLVAGIFGALLLTYERRPRLAGFLLGALAFKPHLALPLPFAFWAGKYYRVLAMAAMGGILLSALSLALFGVDSWLAFFADIGQAATFMAAGKIPLDRMTSTFTMIRLAGGDVTLAYALQAGISLFSLLSVIAVWHKAETSPQMKGIVLGLAILMTSPHVFHYDQTTLMIVLLLWLKEIERGEKWKPLERPLLFLGWLAPSYLTALALGSVYSLYPFMLILLMLFALRRINAQATT